MTAKLTPRQRKAIESLLTAGDVSAAATAAGVSRETLYRWMKAPDFTAELHQAEAAAIDSLSRALVALGGKATETLQMAMDDQEAATSARVRAADIVLSRLLQLRELATLEERVKRLEEKQNEQLNQTN